MKIASTQLQLETTHAFSQQHEIRESMRMWVGDRRPDFEGRGQIRPQIQSPVFISPAAHRAQAHEAQDMEASNAVEDSLDEAGQDLRLALLRQMIFLLTGKEVQLLDTEDLKPPPAADLPAAPARRSGGEQTAPIEGYGVEYDYHESYTEAEQTSFTANGTVVTSDGKKIDFAVSLTMSRSYHEESDIQLRLGDAARISKDPLVLNFGGTAAQLSDQRFAFDIDADGQKDQINRLASGSGFLALDRNGDGKINDGSELFGASSGDGFAELAILDDDDNGWIDESDQAFAALRLWTPGAEGQGELKQLTEVGVGALGLMRVATPFDLRNEANETLGQVRSSGVFLQEDGKTGTMQQLDLSV